MTQRPPDTAPVIDRAVLEAEVERIIDATERAGSTVRVMGSIGVAIHAHASASMLEGFGRTYADIDLAAYRGDATTITSTMASLGYRDDREVYVASEGQRSIFDDPARGIHIDVFYDRLEFCHVIPLARRLATDTPTIPLAELLLSKLQIARINERDVIDIALLLLDHPLGSSDDETIDITRIASLCADDWGLWRTLTQNLDKVRSLVAGYPQLDADQRSRVTDAAASVKASIDDRPKSMSWRMRDRIGDRRQWWTDVEEVHPRS